MNFSKQLSTRYLKDAKILGYTWMDLLRRITRQKVINQVIKYRIDNAIYKAKKDLIDDEIHELHIQLMMNKIKKKHERLTRRQKQTADVLMFQRYEYAEIPKGRRIAFRDDYGKPYILKLRRYFIIDRINTRDANRYNGKRIYDYYDDNGRRDDFDKVVNLLKTSNDFNDLYKEHKTYMNCIIIKSLTDTNTDTNNETKANDLLDEDLFMSREELGVYSRYININLDKRVRNVQDNSCYVNIIVHRFQKAFIKAYQRNKRYKFDLTAETLCDLCGIEYKNENIGLSINKSLTFFKKFNLGLHVYGPFGSIFKYKPEKRNRNLNPSHRFIYILNNHCYEINHNIKEFEQLHWAKPISDDNISNEFTSLNISDKYTIRQQSTMDCSSFVNTIDDAIDFIKSYNTDCTEEIHIVPIIYNDYLDKLLFAIINILGYTPDIKMMSGKITSLLVKYNNILFNITLSDTKANDTDVWIDKDNFELYNTIDDAFYNGLICQEHISTYNKQTIKIEHLLPMGPKSGYFTEHVSQPLMGIDSRKAYTSDFMSIEYFPVFNHFDIWQEYDNHKIEDYTQYIVKVDPQYANPILFSGTYSRCYGYKLNRINENFMVMYYRRPSNLVLSNSRSLVKNVFNSKLPMDLKKFIVNKNLGLIEKKKNKKSVCKAFKNCNEALYYQTKLNKGQIYSINEEETIKTKEGIDPLDEGIDTLYSSPTISYKVEVKDTLHILCVSKEENLINGFLPIKELIYEIRDLKNYNTYKRLKDAKIQVYGIKTDSIMIADTPKNVKTVRGLYDLSDKIGNFKIERNKYLINSEIRCNSNELPKIDRINVREHTINNEYDNQELLSIMNDKNIFVKGWLPGVGKTSACKNYMNSLFVSPYNKLCQDLRNSGHDAITLNRLLGHGIDENLRFKNYDTSSYNCIVFDEILLYNPRQLYSIKMYMEQNNDKRYLCTGDIDQRKPFNFGCNNVDNQNEYQLLCVNQMFPDQITLKINKRLKHDEDKVKLRMLKDDILDIAKNPIESFKKHGIKIINKMKDVDTTNNICLFNFRCDQVNNHVSKNIIQKDGFFKGMEVVCKSHYKTKKFKLYVNYYYTIKSINKDEIIIHEQLDNNDISLTYEVFNKHFKMPYANTCDSLQGMSIDNKITIFDCNTPYVDRYFIWTALTRSTNLNNVQIYEHSKEEVMSLKRSWVRLYFNQKIHGYKQQDIKNGRHPTSDDYIDPEWFKLQYRTHKKCPLCGVLFEVKIHEDNKVTSNITADRIDNNKPHIKSNCKLACVSCNVAKR